MSNRLSPLPRPWPDAIAARLARYPGRDGEEKLALFRTFARSPRFLAKGVPDLLDAGSPLPTRARELVILRVTARNGCGYEWGIHARLFARAARLGPAELAATAAPDPRAETAEGAPDWSEADLRLLDALDALLADGRLPDAAQADFEADWSMAAQLEILALVGAYTTVSLVANVARLPAESFALAFPGDAPIPGGDGAEAGPESSPGGDG